RFIVARGTLRHILARKFNQTPERIAFCYSEYGKPYIDTSPIQAKKPELAQLQPGACDFHFNMSHSGELALCALGQDCRVGIDIEKLKDIQRLDSMMERCLTEKERLDVVASDEPLRAFLQRWTCKEAYLKAIGLGLMQSMQTVEVEVTSPQLLSQLLKVPETCAAGWNLSVMDVPDDYVGAVVVEGKSAIEVCEWQH
ncbi:MAG: 4'-phosphopantetheinyl transferase superfamily protein, partial [Cyanobacteria bacterium J06632_3]